MLNTREPQELAGMLMTWCVSVQLHHEQKQMGGSVVPWLRLCLYLFLIKNFEFATAPLCFCIATWIVQMF